MIDKRMALTFSVRNNPGVYALLVGSGISKEAEVPTGWDIIKDLIKKVAEAEGEEIESEPVDWYEEKYGEKPRYDDLLEQLSPSKEDRQALLESYFEPDNEEREKGIKTPSESHESIAWLVKEGYIKIIVTTNFDRLLEQALGKKGITPTVISKPSDAKGAAPLAHQDAVILKVNGDYKASTLKNTSDELESYDPAIERLIEQVLDEYGLIVCGWSGGWDSALRDLILSAENRRYSMYWASYSDLGDEAKELIDHRDGTVVSIDGAGEFFYDLKERVQALEDAGPGAPLSKEVAKERAKRYLTREERKIDLADLIRDETDFLCGRLVDADRFDLHAKKEDDTIKERLRIYEKEVETLASILSTCVYWGPDVPNSAEESIRKSVRRLATTKPDMSPYYECWENLARYPTTLLVYSMGVAAVESENWSTIYNILIDTMIQPYSSVKEPVVLEIHPAPVGTRLIYRDNTTFLKNRIRDVIREPLEEFVPENNEYEDAFYEFELIADAVYADMAEKTYGRTIALPNQRYFNRNVDEVVRSRGEDWGPLKAGLFDGSLDRFEELIQR